MSCACVPQSVDIKSLLAQVSLFDGIQAVELANLAVVAREIHAVRGETLFRKGDACNGLYLVIYGQVKLFFASSLGHEKILDIVDEGQAIGESSLFQGKEYPFFAQTLSDTHLLHIARPAITHLVVTSPAFSQRVIDNMAQRVFDLTEDVESYSLDSGRQRVINYLLREAQRSRLNEPASSKHGISCKSNALTLTLSISKGAIASRLSLTQEHFSRLLHELTECGLLSVGGREIQLHDLSRLRQYACCAELYPATRQASLPIGSKALVSVHRRQNVPLIRPF